jgi:hypothetical protein
MKLQNTIILAFLFCALTVSAEPKKDKSAKEEGQEGQDWKCQEGVKQDTAANANQGDENEDIQGNENQGNDNQGNDNQASEIATGRPVGPASTTSGRPGRGAPLLKYACAKLTSSFPSFPSFPSSFPSFPSFHFFHSL